MTRRWEWLAALIQRHELRRGVEVGVKEGQTMAYVLEACPRLTMTGVDLWKPVGAYRDWPQETYYRNAKERLARFGQRAQLVRMDSDRAARLFDDQSIDLVFIDADHSTEAVIADVQAWRPKVRSGGWMTGHDWSWPSVRRALTEVLPKAKPVGVDQCWAAQL